MERHGIEEVPFTGIIPLCRPKANGWLVIRLLFQMNCALLGYWTWMLGITLNVFGKWSFHSCIHRSYLLFRKKVRIF